MGETQGMIHPKVKCHSRCEPVKPVKLFTSKIQWCKKQRIDNPIPKMKNCRQGSNDGSQASPKRSNVNAIRFYGLRIIFFGHNSTLQAHGGDSIKFRAPGGSSIPLALCKVLARSCQSVKTEEETQKDPALSNRHFTRNGSLMIS